MFSLWWKHWTNYFILKIWIPHKVNLTFLLHHTKFHLLIFLHMGTNFAFWKTNQEFLVWCLSVCLSVCLFICREIRVKLAKTDFNETLHLRFRHEYLALKIFWYQLKYKYMWWIQLFFFMLCNIYSLVILLGSVMLVSYVS